MSVALKSAVDDGVVDELRAIVGDDDRVLPNLSSRVNRTRCRRRSPSTAGRSSCQMSRSCRARRMRSPRSQARQSPPRPRGAARRRHGPLDGAVPLRGGILVDVKLMNRIHEVDLVNRTVTVGPGINMLKLNEELKRHGVFYPDDPASYRAPWSGGGSAPADGRCSARASATRART